MLAICLGLSLPGDGFAGEAPVTRATTPPANGEPEIIFNAKVFCSLKRRIELPFKGVITALKVHSGQQVKAGDVLATYRLAPEARMAIQQRLSPPQLAEMEMKLSAVQRNMVPLKNKQRELNQLVQKKLAPSQGLAQVNEELQFLVREKATLQERLKKDRQLAQQDQEVLSSLVGTALKPGQVPREVSLKAPCSGYVVWVNPEMREGAELNPMPAAFQVGVMDPMLLRAQAFEIEALQVKIGQKADVTLDALPGKKFQATVSRVAWSSIATGPEQPAYYEVELKVPNPDLDLKEGLKARIVLRKSE
ncbi:MAG: efflux RND transporter periplasmic adaptor subunit [Desulfobacterales bacterium]|nr:efflux RND transporter periplasmic adaptor subunit [Pseudomonadota bacterium]MCG2770765.1 efflux RND transporter periplasmic adaptor subunit [Desulfobacterales bacterium]